MSTARPDLVALVVGAASRRGREAVTDLSRPGACLGLAGADADELAPLVLAAHDAGARATLLPGDLTHPGMAARVVDAVRNAYGRLDLLVLALDAAPFDPLAVDPATGRARLERAVVGPFLVLHEAGRVLAAGGAGRVVLIEPASSPVSIAPMVRASGLETVLTDGWSPALLDR